MNIAKIAGTAFKNTFRSKVRTFLTAVAIFIGAFTLMLTNGIGTGVNSYIDTQLDSIGGDNVMNVSKGRMAESTDGPTEYDPEKKTNTVGGSPSLEVLTTADIETVRGIEGVQSVRPVYFVQTKYITAGEKEYELNVNVSLPGGDLDYMAGTGVTDDTKNQVVLPGDYIEPLGFSSPEDAVGKTVEIGAPNVTGKIEAIEAVVVGVQKPVLIDLGMNTSESVRNAIYEVNREGLPDGTEETFLQAQVTYDNTLGEEHIQSIKDALAEEGFEGTTVTDQIGMFKTIIDIIVTILNGFAVIALVAAGFGIINTLLMSVQERTREIGLMKAMGLGPGRIFTLFTFEALFIGLLGSALGIGFGWLAGAGINLAAEGTLSALGGIDIIIFTLPNVLAILGTILVIAFIAGTMPAARAAKQNPIDALRYE